MGIIGSSRPWARKIGTPALAALRSAPACAPAAGSPTAPPARPGARGGAAPVSSVDRAALREAASTMRVAGTPRWTLALDQRFDAAPATRAARPRPRGRAVGAEDVVPGAHAEPIVDRHRPHRRVREDEAHRPRPAGSSSGTMGSKSLPSAPRPCSKITRRTAAGRFRPRWFPAIALMARFYGLRTAALHCSAGAGQHGRETAPCLQEEDNYETYPDGRRIAGAGSRARRRAGRQAAGDAHRSPPTTPASRASTSPSPWARPSRTSTTPTCACCPPATTSPGSRRSRPAARRCRRWASACYFAQEAVFEFGAGLGPAGAADLCSLRRLQRLNLGVAKDTGVKEIKDLKGKRVGFVVGAPSLNQNALATLAFAGLTRNDVTHRRVLELRRHVEGHGQQRRRRCLRLHHHGPDQGGGDLAARARLARLAAQRQGGLGAGQKIAPFLRPARGDLRLGRSQRRRPGDGRLTPIRSSPPTPPCRTIWPTPSPRR